MKEPQRVQKSVIMDEYDFVNGVIVLYISWAKSETLSSMTLIKVFVNNPDE